MNGEVVISKCRRSLSPPSGTGQGRTEIDTKEGFRFPKWKNATTRPRCDPVLKMAFDGLTFPKVTLSVGGGIHDLLGEYS